jgi:predicted thioesterase
MTSFNAGSIKAGLRNACEHIVSETDSARYIGSGLLDVYSTPSMIALMEKCSMLLVQEHLPPGYGTVGTAIDVKHLKASRIGSRLRAEALLLETDNRRLVFEVNVSEGDKLIGTGRHERFIINEELFLLKTGIK